MSMRTIHARHCDEVEKLIPVADEDVKRCFPFYKRTVTGDVLKQVSDGDKKKNVKSEPEEMAQSANVIA